MAGFVGLSVAPISAEMSPELIPADTEEGRARLARSVNRYSLLKAHFQPQKTLSTCSIASSCTALRAVDPDLRGLTESEFLRTAPSLEKVRSILFSKRGVSLDEMSEWLAKKFPVVAYARHAAGIDANEFTEDVLQALETEDTLVEVNFYGRDMGLGTGGHFSVVGGYDPVTGSVLILDVAKHKFPDYWVPVKNLMNGMSSTDPTTGLSRGYVKVYGGRAACGALFGGR